jgi:hypothetical protein
LDDGTNVDEIPEPHRTASPSAAGDRQTPLITG